MTPTQFWQNFKLGQEQEIAAGFIYDGLRILHDTETLGQETDIFPVLYNLSIGIERLSKVAIILIEFKDDVDIEKFEKSLKTHEHLRLLEKVKKATSVTLNPPCVEFLELLSVFYNTHRYDRLSFQELTVFSKDKKAFLDFLHKHLGIDIKEESSIFYVENSPEVKNFIGRLVKDIARALYKVIQEFAGKKGLNTDEISSSSSKAGKVLMGDESITFEGEDRAMVEALIFLMTTKDSSLVDFMKETDPLPLDSALDSEYLQAILYKRPKEMQGVIDEVESYYDEMGDVKDRLEAIDAIKNPGIGF
ncbi:MAG: hypothetical protein AAB388_02335 [Patescibacteria group bacterium]